MRNFLSRPCVVFLAALPFSVAACAQQTSGALRWIDFHAPQDQNIVTWVERSLSVEKWTALREIGVEYDAALVVTADRAQAQARPDGDTISFWSVSLVNHAVTPILTGVNVHWFDLQNFVAGSSAEPAILYDNCRDCAAGTYFTSFHYDAVRHAWLARWLRGGQTVPVWNTKPAEATGTTWTQVYALLPGAEDKDELYTWNHFDYGKMREPSDTVFRYDVDPATGLDRSVALSGAAAEAAKLRLCRGQNAIQGIERGQDSALCMKILMEHPQRRPVTTPPAGNRGQSNSGF